MVDGSEIDPQRLEAVPWTAFCIKHPQQAQERLGVRTPSQ
jgi:RNA polymerase-binding transcription factor DksA